MRLAPLPGMARRASRLLGRVRRGCAVVMGLVSAAVSARELSAQVVHMDWVRDSASARVILNAYLVDHDTVVGEVEGLLIEADPETASPPRLYYDATSPYYASDSSAAFRGLLHSAAPAALAAFTKTDSSDNANAVASIRPPELTREEWSALLAHLLRNEQFQFGARGERGVKVREIPQPARRHFDAEIKSLFGPGGRRQPELPHLLRSCIVVVGSEGADTTTLTFGSTRVGRLIEDTLTLWNFGGKRARVVAQITPPGSGFSLKDHVIQVLPGRAQAIPLVFAPKDTVSRSARLRLTADGLPPIQATLAAVPLPALDRFGRLFGFSLPSRVWFLLGLAALIAAYVFLRRNPRVRNRLGDLFFPRQDRGDSASLMAAATRRFREVEVALHAATSEFAAISATLTDHQKLLDHLRKGLGVPRGERMPAMEALLEQLDTRLKEHDDYQRLVYALRASPQFPTGGPPPDVETLLDHVRREHTLRQDQETLLHALRTLPGFPAETTPRDEELPKRIGDALAAGSEARAGLQRVATELRTLFSLPHPADDRPVEALLAGLRDVSRAREQERGEAAAALRRAQEAAVEQAKLADGRFQELDATHREVVKECNTLRDERRSVARLLGVPEASEPDALQRRMSELATLKPAFLVHFEDILAHLEALFQEMRDRATSPELRRLAGTILDGENENTGLRKLRKRLNGPDWLRQKLEWQGSLVDLPRDRFYDGIVIGEFMPILNHIARLSLYSTIRRPGLNVAQKLEEGGVDPQRLQHALGMIEWRLATDFETKLRTVRLFEDRFKEGEYIKAKSTIIEETLPFLSNAIGELAPNTIYDLLSVGYSSTQVDVKPSVYYVTPR